MREFETDEQRAEALVAWLKENIRAIVIGVVLGLAGLGGWKWWQGQQSTQIQALGTEYYQLTQQEKLDTAQTIAAQIQQQAPKSAYNLLAQLDLAALAVEQDKLDQAQAALESIKENAPDDGIKTIVNLRYARVLFEADHLDQALSVLGTLNDKHFQGLRHELEGDILLKQNKLTAAATAYQAAETAGDASTQLTLKKAWLAKQTASSTPATEAAAAPTEPSSTPTEPEPAVQAGSKS